MKAFRESAALAGSVRVGKQGLAGQHRERVVESQSARVAASVNFEDLSRRQPEGRRVDYFLESSRCVDRMHAVEVHAFRPSDLVQKKTGTVALLSTICPAAIPQIESWHVIIQGEMPRRDIKARFEADTQIEIAGRTLSVEQLCREHSR